MTALGVHPASLVLVAAHALGLRVARSVREEPGWLPPTTSETVEEEPGEAATSLPLRHVIALFVAVGALLAAGGWAVARAAESLVVNVGLSESLVGAGVMGVADAMPELVTSVAAVRRGALTLAISGVLSGNAFDVLNVAVGDVAFRGGSIYHAIAPSDTVPTLAALLVTLVVLAGLLRRQRSGPGNVGFEGVTLLAVWLAALALVASH